jgi:hypothetical protein
MLTRLQSLRRPAPPTRTPTARTAAPRLRAALLLLLALALAAAPAAAQAEERLPRERSPLIAGALGLYVPGFGHYYVGERKEAYVIAATVFAGFAVFASGVLASSDCYAPDCEAEWAEHRIDIGTGIILGAYAFSVVDAPLAARRHNRARRAAASAAPTARLIIGARGAPGLEIRLPTGR